jgi:translation initiation factor IF-3
VTIKFRGRETLHAEFGEKLLDRLANDVSDIAKIETPAKLDGRNMTMVLSPYKEAITPRPAPAPRPKRSRPETRRQKETEDAAEEAVVPRPPKVTRAEGG